MAKMIPYVIKRRGLVDDDGWNVIDQKTKEIVEHFDTKQEAEEYVKSLRQTPDGEWEPDYEDIMEQRAGDPERALDAMERSYEKEIGRT